MKTIPIQIMDTDYAFLSEKASEMNTDINEIITGIIHYWVTSQTKNEIVFEPPPTKNIDQVISQMRETGRYSDEFLSSLSEGMKESIYFSESR